MLGTYDRSEKEVSPRGPIYLQQPSTTRRLNPCQSMGLLTVNGQLILACRLPLATSIGVPRWRGMPPAVALNVVPGCRLTTWRQILTSGSGPRGVKHAIASVTDHDSRGARRQDSQALRPSQWHSCSRHAQLAAIASFLLKWRILRLVHMKRPPGGVDPTWPVSIENWTKDEDDSVWVAADESGTTGEDLLSDQPVMAHATVRIDDHTAAEILADLRDRARSIQAEELKFRHVRRGRAAEALAEILAPGGALAGRVNVVVAFKPYMAVGKVIDLLIEEWATEQGIDLYEGRRARTMARALFRDGPRGLGETWQPFLDAFVRLARPGQAEHPEEGVEAFFAVVEKVQRRNHRRSLDLTLAMLGHSGGACRALGGRNQPRGRALAVLLGPTRCAAAGQSQALVPGDRQALPTAPRRTCRAHPTPGGANHDRVGQAVPRPALGREGRARAVRRRNLPRPPLDTARRPRRRCRQNSDQRFPKQRVDFASSLTEAVTPTVTWGLLPDDSFWERQH